METKSPLGPFAFQKDLLTVRPLSLLDGDQVYEILHEIYQSPESPLGGRWSPGLILSELRGGHGLGAFSSRGELAAFVLYRQQSVARDISVLATRKSHQNKGLMRRLLEKFLFEEAQEVWLEVHEENKVAAQLYESLGFEKTGERKAYYRDGGNAYLFKFTPKTKA